MEYRVLIAVLLFQLACLISPAPAYGLWMRLVPGCIARVFGTKVRATQPAPKVEIPPPPPRPEGARVFSYRYRGLPTEVKRGQVFRRGEFTVRVREGLVRELDHLPTGYWINPETGQKVYIFKLEAWFHTGPKDGDGLALYVGDLRFTADYWARHNVRIDWANKTLEVPGPAEIRALRERALPEHRSLFDYGPVHTDLSGIRWFEIVAEGKAPLAVDGRYTFHDLLEHHYPLVPKLLRDRGVRKAQIYLDLLEDPVLSKNPRFVAALKDNNIALFSSTGPWGLEEASQLGPVTRAAKVRAQILHGDEVRIRRAFDEYLEYVKTWFIHPEEGVETPKKFIQRVGKYLPVKMSLKTDADKQAFLRLVEKAPGEEMAVKPAQYREAALESLQRFLAPEEFRRFKRALAPSKTSP